MARHSHRLTAQAPDGGTLTIEQQGGGFRITHERGFKESPEARLERLRHSKRGGFHSDKRTASRSRVRQDLRRGEW